MQFIDRDGARQMGYTQDLSLSGFLVAAASLPRVGEPLTLTLHLPNGKVVDIAGNVVRETSIASRSTPSGFGFALSDFVEDYTRLVSSLG